MGWTEQRLSKEEQALTNKLTDGISAVYEKMVPSLAEARDPVEAAGRTAAELFYSVLTKANAKGKRIPKNVSRGVLVNVTQDMMQIAHEGGLVQPQSREEASQMLSKAMVSMRNAYAWREAQTRAGKNDPEKQAKRQMNAQAVRNNKKYLNQQQAPQQQAPQGLMDRVQQGMQP